MNSVIEKRQRTARASAKISEHHPSRDFHYTVDREYNLKDRMQELMGRNDDFSGELEGVNLVIGIILSIALMIFVAL